MSSEFTSGNQVWAGAFQLAWDEAKEELGNLTNITKEARQTVEGLNEGDAFSADDLSGGYYQKHGINDESLRQEIENGIAKLGERSQILDDMNWDASGMLFYAMLKKDLKFTKPFKDMGEDSFGTKEEKVKYFGASQFGKDRESVYVLFYNSENDFAVRLSSKRNDEIYLYRTDDKGNFKQLYEDMQAKEEAWPHHHSLDEEDSFKAPILNFNAKKEFVELEGLSFKNGYTIQKAMENVQFEINKEGVKVVSEGEVGASRGVSIPWNCDFTDRYVIFIQEQGKKPYFALLVEDPTKLQ